VTDLTIIIVSYNTREELADCLRSIAAHPPATPHRIIVVDNASTDGTVEALRSVWPSVLVIEAGANVGFAAANNMGIRAAEGEFVVLLNSDTLVPMGALDTLVAALRASPDVLAIGPRLVGESGRPELSFGRMMSPFSELRQKLIVRLYEAGFGPAIRLVERWTRTEGDHDWVSGACLMVRREAALAAGLLDERYFLYAEDVDFCAALRQSGGRVRFTPHAEVVHLRGRSGAQRPEATQRAYRRSQLAFYRKHHPRWHRWLRAYLRLRGRLPDSGA
jgi:N-acetylglucosaminyl-diphospho-decaprenol L-rhamnosyltransferase